MWYPSRQRMLKPITESRSRVWISVACAVASGDSRGASSKHSGVASEAYIRARERAVNTPLAAGNSLSWMRSLSAMSRKSSTTSASTNGR